MIFVKVKSSQGSLNKNKGTEKAPDLILENVNKANILECKIDEQNIEKTNELIEEQKGDFFIGGDHSITYALFKAFAEKYPDKKIGLIVLDAHPDCTSNFNPPTHEDFIRVLIEQKILNPDNLMLIGLRNIDPLEDEYLKEKNINHILMKNMNLNNEKNKKDIIKRLNDFIETLDLFYLSIDIDFLDEKDAPGTGYPEKNGASIEELIYLIKNLAKKKKLKRIDLVEVNPLKDKNNITINNSKRILDIFN